MAGTDVVIEHPNRHKAGSHVTRVAVIVLLLVSAVLTAIVTIGGWSALVGMQFIQIAYILLYVLMAFYVARWNRGVLPVAAALAIILLIFAAVAAPAWFSRDKAGFTNPALSAETLGFVTSILIPVQVLLILFTLRGFQQAWNVEVERHPDGSTTSSDGTRTAAAVSA